MSDKLMIDFVTGATVGKDLKGCFFMQKNDGTFDFHDEDGHRVAHGLTLGESFQVNLPGDPQTWTISLAEVLHLKGSWSDGTTPQADGGYQAQAGGSGEGEEGAASAYA